MKFIDPDGKQIIIPIRKNSNYSIRAFQHLQRLTDEPLALMKDGRVLRHSEVGTQDILNVKATGAYDIISNKNFGTSLIGEHLDASYTITIQDDGKWGSRVRTDRNERRATVYFDVDDNKSIMNQNGSRGASASRVLGHELIHVRNRMNNKADDTKVEVIDPDTGRAGSLTIEEINTRREEQKISEELLERKRAQLGRIDN